MVSLVIYCFNFKANLVEFIRVINLFSALKSISEYHTLHFPLQPLPLQTAGIVSVLAVNRFQKTSQYRRIFNRYIPGLNMFLMSDLAVRDKLFEQYSVLNYFNDVLVLSHTFNHKKVLLLLLAYSKIVAKCITFYQIAKLQSTCSQHTELFQKLSLKWFGSIYSENMLQMSMFVGQHFSNFQNVYKDFKKVLKIDQMFPRFPKD